jgi:hypothetical protein
MEKERSFGVYLNIDDQLAHIARGVDVLSKWLDCCARRDGSNGSGEQLDELRDGCETLWANEVARDAHSLLEGVLLIGNVLCRACLQVEGLTVRELELLNTVRAKCWRAWWQFVVA